MSAEPEYAPLVFPTRLIPAKATLRPPLSLPDYLPARMLNEFVYCPRLFFYEWVDGVFAHSADTVEGALRHEKLGEKAEAMPAADQAIERIHARSVTLTSEAYRLIATIDLVEGDGDRVSPVDYKRGMPHERDEMLDAWPADRAQVCAQALILRDNGYRCDEAIVYYNTTKQRVRVVIDDPLITETVSALTRARAVAASGMIPPPLNDSPKCPRCSLVSICLPDETRAAMAWRDPEESRERQLGLFEIGGTDVLTTDVGEAVRRLVPARDDLRQLYVTGYNFTVGKSNDVLQIREKGQRVQEVRIREISQVSVFGNVSLTAGAVQALCEAERPVAHFSYGGWFYGLTQGLGLKNVFLRQEQFRRAEEEAFCLRVAREIVASKIRNQRTLLQRNHVEPPARAIDALRRLANQALDAGRLETLLGLEGTAAHTTFPILRGC